MIKPFIKWPGGKSSELSQFKSLVPKFDRYIEPFFGGGALYFYLQPERAAINDISEALMDLYILLRDQDEGLHRFLLAYDDSFQGIQKVAGNYYEDLYSLLEECMENNAKKEDMEKTVYALVEIMADDILATFSRKLILNLDTFFKTIAYYVTDKLFRIAKNNEKSKMSKDDIYQNLITGFTSGYYMYFRSVYNDLMLNRCARQSMSYRVANFYFIREYCYGSMFRYNAKGEFNIPYGGISYNVKNFRQKIDAMFNEDVEKTFQKTEIYSQDFDTFFDNIKPTENDFIFLDPPYDTEFSDYEGHAFTKDDHVRLANTLITMKAKFVMVIKNTDFIWSLYREQFTILRFNNQYLYNMRSRNDRTAEHLIITNLPLDKLHLSE